MVRRLMFSNGAVAEMESHEGDLVLLRLEGACPSGEVPRLCSEISETCHMALHDAILDAAGEAKGEA